MKAMYFAHTFRKPCLEAFKLGGKLQKFFSDILKCAKFQKWLEYILAFGNYMNGVGFYGGAYGFKMDAIKKICELKTTDDKRNLMEYIIEVIGRNEKDREILDYYQELQELQEGKINY
jgi:hypothetical protein